MVVKNPCGVIEFLGFISQLTLQFGDQEFVLRYLLVQVHDLHLQFIHQLVLHQERLRMAMALLNTVVWLVRGDQVAEPFIERGFHGGEPG